MNLWIPFLTGLTTGGLSCLAVQGGVLASIIANQKETELDSQAPNTHLFNRNDWLPITTFLLTKLAAHGLLGFALGSIGSTLSLSPSVRLLFQAFAALFMFATAMNLLKVHPIFRFVGFQPPRFITRHIGKLKKNKSLFAPAVLGVATIFIPCGVTQAMEVQTIALADPVQSMLLMSAFVVGTTPMFAIFGVAMAKLSDEFSQKFLRLAAFILIGVSLVSINGILEVLNFPLTWSTISQAADTYWNPPTRRKTQGTQAILDGAVQKITLSIIESGYSPRTIRVKKNVPVELTLTSKDVYSCALDFHLRAFGIREFLQPNDTKVVRFTPQTTGNYPFTCGMGMYTGVVEVF